jgi:hypothetical protein
MKQTVSDRAAAIDVCYNLTVGISSRLEHSARDPDNPFIDCALSAIDTTRRLLLAARNFETAKTTPDADPF